MSTVRARFKDDVGLHCLMFDPPLTDEEFLRLPRPKSSLIRGKEVEPVSIETDELGRVTVIGFDKLALRSLGVYNWTLIKHFNGEDASKINPLIS